MKEILIWNPWFWVFAIAWSALQGIAGWTYGMNIYADARAKTLKADPENPWLKDVERRRWLKVLAYYLPHSFLYIASSLAGFSALSVVSRILLIKSYSAFDVSAGTGSILIAFSILAIAGISGVLAPILWRGDKLVDKFPIKLPPI